MPTRKSNRGGATPTTLGRRAEHHVAQLLKNNGYSILGQNIRIGHLELDIIARKGPTIVIVEVRLRTPASWQSPLESINPTKQRRLLDAAEQIWTSTFAEDPTIERIRIDVAAVYQTSTEPEIDYFEGVINANDPF
ncbi:MAG: YraN family protein [Polyangiaceae bacterium]|nr:YraN family protein [Polyangiaceae bacterium]